VPGKLLRSNKEALATNVTQGNLSHFSASARTEGRGDSSAAAAHVMHTLRMALPRATCRLAHALPMTAENALRVHSTSQHAPGARARSRFPWQCKLDPPATQALNACRGGRGA
jgi:hypothetical protein